MANRHQQQWEALGETDPYWAVITDPHKKHGRWEPTEFFETGVREIDGLLTKVAGLGIRVSFGRALDYGCGVGRLSRALSLRFPEVLAVDFSATMLSEARKVNAGIRNIRYLRNNGRDLAEVDGESIDFIYSTIALQHVPAGMQRGAIREFCRVLRRGGVVAFQTPARHNLGTASGIAQAAFGNRLLNLFRRIVHGKGRVMEVHVLPKDDVVALLRDCGLSVAEVERYDVAGEAFESYRYFAVKA
jgi:SAM-dependent methyltransferase